MEKFKYVAALSFGAGLIMFYFRTKGMQIAVMVGAIIGAAYCFHKAFDRRGYARNTNFDTRVGWLTGAVGIAYGLFVFLKWEWWEQLGLAFGVMLCLTAILGILMGGKS